MTEEESLMLAINEDVAIAPYHPAWPKMFSLERERLMNLFSSQIIDVQNFGSTATPNMPAKPIIDLLGGVKSIEVADSVSVPLLNSGYVTS